MHTSIAVCLMMVGGYIYPECEVATVPLKDDLTRPNPIQDQEWKERVKRVPLPQVPSIDVSSQAGDNRAAPYRYNPNLMRPQQQPFMPSAPTQEGPGSNGQVGINGQPGYGPAVNNGQPGYGPAGGANPATNYISPNATAQDRTLCMGVRCRLPMWSQRSIISPTITRCPILRINMGWGAYRIRC